MAAKKSVGKAASTGFKPNVKEKSFASVTANLASAVAATPILMEPPALPVLPTTGKYIIIYKPDVIGKPKSVKESLSNKAGIKNLASTSDFSDGVIGAEILQTNTAIHFEHLGIAVVANEEEAISLSQSISDINSPILAIEPEYLAYPSVENDMSTYLRGYRDAINNFWHSYQNTTVPLPSIHSDIEARTRIHQFQDTDTLTWGLQATKVNTSRFSGRGIRVAILDTGFDDKHLDFGGRSIVTASFSGFPVDDIHGHGTHCIGTACGPQNPASGVRRYGIAYNAEIFAGKVFNNDSPRPSAATSNVIAGIEWAITQDCHIASLSLGVAMNAPIQQYKSPMRRALNAGLLVVAAAGNNANRPFNAGFVEPPANSDSVMAVAAIDQKLEIASFSARSSQISGEGGKVNIAAPGVGVYSSIPGTLGSHGFKDGTSMATPHVAGIAALWAEAKGERGAALWSRLIQTVMPLSGSSEDVGAGLVQAPQ